MKKTVKIISSIIIMITILATMASVVLATEFSPKNIQAADPGDVKDLTVISGKILGGAQIIGVSLSVIILVVLGIKYMMGSAEEKAEYKKSMVPYLVGAVLIFAAPTIANIIYNIVKPMGTTAAE